jgi:hypothetical protein
LKITTEPITGVQPIELVKKGAIYTVLGNLLISVWKRNWQKRLANLSSPRVKLADMDRNVKGTVLQG